MFAARPVAVAIPVRNEAARIGQCLRALAAQAPTPPDIVVLLLNDCTDETVSVVEGLRASLPYTLHAIPHHFAAGEGGAGWARALAMRHAADLLGPDGILLTTDADGRVATDWLAANLRAMAAGADAVAGRAVIDPVDALRIPQSLHDDDARECAYAALLDELTSLLDPDPADPWPRHSEESGASLAVTTSWYHRVGGVPKVRLGEDRAFVAALRRHDAAVRHAPEVLVTVSGRIDGRAEGGMADTIRRRLSAPDPFIDDRLEPAAAAARRATLRRQARGIFAARSRSDAVADIADLVGLDRAAAETLGEHATFGALWEAIEAAIPSLVRQPVPVTRLAQETARAEAMLENLRDAGGLIATHDPAGTLADAAS